MKYKVESPFLHHCLEIFQIKYEDFFSCVSRFHLPCVRGYYNGDNVYLLPSCISAHMTYINMDYKYFAGSKDPIEIINKYRTRGFGTILNDKEKIHLVEYSNQINKWKNLYQINIKDQNSVNKVFGNIDYNSRLYKPRLYNSEEYHDSVYVSDTYNQINMVSYIYDEDEYMNELNRLYNYNDIGINTLRFRTIKDSGYVMPLKTWIMDAVWDQVNSQF